jgi:transposase
VARSAATIELSDDEESELRAVLRTPSVSQQQAMRARIVLRAAESASNTQIAAEVGVSLPTVWLWRRNFSERGLDGLQTAPRAGRPREIDDCEVALVLVRAYPRRPLHVVLDNSSTHSTPEVMRWLQRHRRVHFHFTPTSASWMNMVEIWFSILTKQQVRRGVYHDVPELIAAIADFIDGYNDRAQPFVWTKTADQVLEKAIKRQDTSETLH